MTPFTLRASILIQAPLERCFLLSTSTEIVHRELGMMAVAGRTHGLVTAGDTVRWEGRQLGLWHSSKSPVGVSRNRHSYVRFSQ